MLCEDLRKVYQYVRIRSSRKLHLLCSGACVAQNVTVNHISKEKRSVVVDRAHGEQRCKPLLALIIILIIVVVGTMA